MNWIKNKLKIVIPLTIVIFGLEFGARLLLHNPNPVKRDFSEYSKAELDKSLSFIHPKNGDRCITLRKGFNWNQWWGFNARVLNLDCAEEFFSHETFNIVFLGGSTMNNAQAPNHLTTLDYMATKNINGVKSINLAESGARHMNMSVKFQRQVIQLKPDLVIFFDGFNEFNSIIYGGNPDDDYYWTIAGKYRIHKPYRLYIDKAIEISKFLELTLIHTGFYSSARNIRNVKYNTKLIHKGADTYLKDKKITSALCNQFSIKCLFIIQPQIFTSTLDEHLDIISRYENDFPRAKEMRISGYNRILKECADCIDFSEALNEVSSLLLTKCTLGRREVKNLEV